MSYPFPKSIADAANLLDKINPGWANKIALAELNMKEDENCIIGQLYGSYWDNWDDLFIEDDDSEDLIFGADANIEEWKREINSRKELTFLEALQAMQEGKIVKYVTEGGVVRELKKKNNAIVDNNNFANTAIFDFWNYKFTLVPPPVLRFSDLKAGQKWRYKYGRSDAILLKLDLKNRSYAYTKLDGIVDGCVVDSANINDEVILIND